MLHASASAVIRETGRKAAFSTQWPANPTIIRSIAVNAAVPTSVTRCVRYIDAIDNPVTIVPMRTSLKFSGMP